MDHQSDFAVPGLTSAAASNSMDASFHVVGIGASAGGLEALEQFFDHMPPDSGLAFVVIQHLSPDFKSLMDELLSRRTNIVIHRVEDGMTVEPNSIYLIPPAKEMIIAGGRLLLTDKDPSHGLTLPIDTFLRSLAQDAGSRAVAVILSGTGSDGSRGIRSVHDAGGLVIAQSEASARFDGMPRSAVETGVVDLVLAPDAIPDAILRHIRHPDARPHPDSEEDALVRQGGMAAVHQLLRDEYGIDFTHYKPNTVGRRIQRRLEMNRDLDLPAYVERLREDPSELNALYRDLLIGVTKFFRDQDAYTRLDQEILPQLIATKPRDEELRVWVAGCATGEEAYSLAILIHEHLRAAGRAANAKIFATDVHRASLEFASAGVYREEHLSEVSPVRLERFFSKHGAGYQVCPEVRKMIVFAPHNVIRDAPFTKLDLISCRNLLIYLQPPAQKKVLSLFHFGLRAGGVLFLGPSESPGEISDEFETLDHHWKIFRKRRDVRLQPDLRLPLGTGFPHLRAANLPPTRGSLHDADLLRAYDALLSKYGPPGFLVNERRELVHSLAGASQYLVPHDGRPSADILDNVDKELKLALSGALQRAAKEQQPVSFTGIRVQTADGRTQQIRLSVEPLCGRTAGAMYFLISLDELAPPPQVATAATAVDMGAASRERISSLEDELRHAKENLQATIEEMETTNEELQATNEELLASNEELQSTNEELHSVNEELYTVNAEHQRKIVELTELNNDMDNLLRSTDVGTIFLDRDLCIRKFTPKIAEAFHVLPQDLGRSIESFSHNIVHPELLDDIRRVLATETPVELDVMDRQGDAYLLRILPYRSKTEVQGVVVTLIDVSRLKQTEQQLRRMSKVFMDAADPVIIEDLDGKIIDLNHEAERSYGWTRAELLGQHISILVPQRQRRQAARLRRLCRQAEHVRNKESWRCDKSGRVHPVLLTFSLLTDEGGQALGIASIAKEISVQKRAEAEAREAVQRRDQFLAMLSHELRNPLHAVSSATEFVDRQPELPPPVREACEVIQRQTRQMARLLDDLLDVSRVNLGKIQLREEVVDLVRLAREAVEAVTPLVRQRGHELISALDDGPLYVQGDAARLLQIQANLLNNAAKYTPPGGRIWLTVRREQNKAVIRVRDSGLGIPSEMLGKIFDLFVQADSGLDRTHGGMGVGLTLVRTLVRMHKGKVWAASDGPGTGSEFTVELPLTEERPALVPDEPVVASAAAGVKMLIVEDNADSRMMLQSLLMLDGHQVLAAEDGLRGLEVIEQEHPEVALVDIGLPGLDGYEVARRIRAKYGPDHIRLVALTGYGRAEDHAAVRAAGFDLHLVKPIDLQQLQDALIPPGRSSQ